MFNILKKNKQNRGVTLIELLVVISIVAILSAVLIVGNNKYRSSTAIQNLADDIGLSVRKAQGYAIGVHGDSSTFDPGFGVHFSTSTQKSFVIFRDVNDDHQYNTGEAIDTLNITNASKILSVTSNNADIIFKRPNPEPSFYSNGSIISGASSVVIIVGDGYGVSKNITISNNGQISVQ